MQKIKFIILAFLLFIPSVYAKGEKVTVYIFTKENETRCTSAIDYLKELKDSDISKYFNYVEYQVWDRNWQENSTNRKLANEVAKKFNDEILGAPYIVIGQKYKLAAFSEEYKAEIRNAIVDAYLDDKYKDIVKETEDKIKESKKYDSVAIVGISLGIVIIISILIYFSRKQIKA